MYTSKREKELMKEENINIQTINTNKIESEFMHAHIHSQENKKKINSIK